MNLADYSSVNDNSRNEVNMRCQFNRMSVTDKGLSEYLWGDERIIFLILDMNM